MATQIFTNGLKLFVEANELAASGGSSVSEFTDLSGNGRHLTASSSQPTIKASGINGKKSILFSGSNNPLVNTGAVTINCGFILCKADFEFSDYDGIISAVTGAGILAGIPGTTTFYDFRYQKFEYRLNDRIYSPVKGWQGGELTNVHMPPAPVAEWGIIFFRFNQPVTLNGVQIGKDRDFSGRLFSGEIALVALYDRYNFCDGDIRANTRSIAYSYQLPVVERFPNLGSRGDTVRIGKRIVTDGQDEPITRIKRGTRKAFSVNFSNLSVTENNRVQAFYDNFYPQKRFVWRDSNIVPPVDTVVRYAVPNEIEISENLQQSTGSTEFAESVLAPEYSVPITQPLIPNESGVIIEPPEVSPNILVYQGNPVVFNGANIQY